MSEVKNPEVQPEADKKEEPEKAIDKRETSPQGRYVKLDVRLGSGAYKDVWCAYDTIEGIEVAWNVVKLSRIPPSERKRIKTEVQLLKDIEHENVIKYHNSWVNREKEEIVFITEVMSSGSLKDYLRKNPMIRWNAVKSWCRQILRGVEFLHSKQIIHRDIKCDNIFINGSTGDIRIGDLGLSTKISENKTTLNGETDRQITVATMTCLGTPEFMAPELYDENYDEKVDIYAFGMACLEMVTALTPYHDCTSAAQIYKRVLNGELPPELEKVHNASAKQFIQICLAPHDARPTATQLLSHAFLAASEEFDNQEVRVRLSRVVECDKDSESEDDSTAAAMDSMIDTTISADGQVVAELAIETAPVVLSPVTAASVESEPMMSAKMHSPPPRNFKTQRVDTSEKTPAAARPHSFSDLSEYSSDIKRTVSRVLRVLPQGIRIQEPPRPGVSVVMADIISKEVIMLRIVVPFEAAFKEIEFEFNMESDDAVEVVREMEESDDMKFVCVYHQVIVDGILGVVREVAERHQTSMSKEVNGTLLSSRSEPAVVDENSTRMATIPLDQQVSEVPLANTTASATVQHDPHTSFLTSSAINNTTHHAMPAPAPIAPIPVIPTPVSNLQPPAMHGQAASTLKRTSTPTAIPPKPSSGIHSASSRPSSGIQSSHLNMPPPSSLPSYRYDHSQEEVTVPLQRVVSGNLVQGRNSLKAASPSKNLESESLHRIPSQSGVLTLSAHVEGVDDVSEDDEDSILSDPEYQDALTKYNDSLSRLEKDFTQRQGSLLSQREKLEETFKRDEEKLIVRKSDLDKQLLNMQEKFKDRMEEFAMRKRQLEENSEKLLSPETVSAQPNSSHISPSNAAAKILQTNHDSLLSSNG